MKLKVINGFIDKDTMIFHQVGTIVEYPEKRAKEIEYKGFGKCLEEPKPSKAKAKVETEKVETKDEEPVKEEVPKKVNRKK